MVQLDNRQLLQSVTKLIEKRDLRALEWSLIATLREIISATSIRLCQLHEDPDVPGRKLVIYARPDDTSGNASLYEPVALESDPALIACLRTEERVSVNGAAGTRVIHPIKSKSGIVGFVTIECEQEDPKDQEIVSILLGFYKNYSSLLQDSQRDELTGLLNRKTFDEKVLQLITLKRASDAANDSRNGCCLAVLDIDHFKRVNDQFGHLYGDEILLLFAQAMVNAFRGADLLFRIGGEEFVVILKDVDLTRALSVLERFRQTIENQTFPQVGKITTSIGASMIAANDLPSSIIDRADQALYYAKNHGRNQVHAHENLVAAGKIAVADQNTDVELF